MVVLELVLGIVIGPHILHLAHSDAFIAIFSNLGLGMLFYFAGYEIDFKRIGGKPLQLGAAGWALSPWPMGSEAPWLKARVTRPPPSPDW